jgi:hypothetical protein
MHKSGDPPEGQLAAPELRYVGLVVALEVCLKRRIAE